MSSVSIENARVFDGEQLGAPRTVFVVDGRIADAAGPDSETVDAAGGALLPGFIDGHVHVDDPAQAEALAQWGVTTALDMGAKNPAIIDGLRGKRGVADLRSAGFPAGPGHGTHIARMGYPPEIGISEPGEAEAWVAARVDGGSDYIKVLLEPTIPGAPAPLSAETATAIVTAAHAAGKKVIAHTTTPATVAIAARAGVDAVTHTPLAGVLDDDVLGELVSRGTVAIPTLSMMKGISENLPEHVRPPGMNFDNAVAALGRLHDAGVVIVAGTDANADSATPARPVHGESLHGELALMVSAGMSPSEVLRSATSAAADFFGLEDRGRIRPGVRADLVLVDGDPTVDITATRGIRGVWVAGERVR